MTTSMPVSGETVLNLHAEVSLQDLGAGEGGVILRIDTGDLYTLNDTALAFLSALDGQVTVRDAAEKVAEAFEAPLETVLADLVELTGELESESLLVRHGN